jgi:hypothetical protein
MRRALSQQAAPNADHFPKGSCVVMRIRLLIVYYETTIKSSKVARCLILAKRSQIHQHYQRPPLREPEQMPVALSLERGARAGGNRDAL